MFVCWQGYWTRLISATAHRRARRGIWQAFPETLSESNSSGDPRGHVVRSDSTIKSVSLPYMDKGKPKTKKVQYLAVNVWYEEEKSK
jgi:hypothetical protein